MDCDICGQPIDEAKKSTISGVDEDGTKFGLEFCSWHKEKEILYALYGDDGPPEPVEPDQDEDPDLGNGEGLSDPGDGDQEEGR